MYFLSMLMYTLVPSFPSLRKRAPSQSKIQNRYGLRIIIMLHESLLIQLTSSSSLMSELVEMTAKSGQLKMFVELRVLIENYFWFIGGRYFAIIP